MLWSSHVCSSVRNCHPSHFNLIVHLILKSVRDSNVSESLLRKKRKDLWWYFPNTYGLQWPWTASKLPLPSSGCDADTVPAIMVLAWPSLTHTGSTENRVTAVAFTQKHSHNIRAEQQYYPPFLITTTRYLEVPMEYYTIWEKPRLMFLFWTRSNLSSLLQESHQCYTSVHSLSLPMDFYFFLICQVNWKGCRKKLCSYLR